MSIASYIKKGVTLPLSTSKWLHSLSPKVVSFGIKTFGVTTSAAYAHFYVGREHGTGLTALAAVSGLNPPLGFIANKILMAKVNLDRNYNYQEGKRTASFSNSQLRDPSGTINRMRQESHRRLIKDRNSSSRVLNNEAMYFHS